MKFTTTRITDIYISRILLCSVVEVENGSPQFVLYQSNVTTEGITQEPSSTSSEIFSAKASSKEYIISTAIRSLVVQGHSQTVAEG